MGFAVFRLRHFDPKLTTLSRILKTNIGRKLGYSVPFLLITYGLCDSFGADNLPDCLQGLFTANTTLLPDKWKDQCDRDVLISLIRKSLRLSKCVLPSASRSDFETEEDWLANCPPRTRADLSVRNIRNMDIILFCDQHFNWDEYPGNRILSVVKLLDYIFAGNFLLACVIFKPYLWFEFWDSYGIWTGRPAEIRDKL